MWNLACVVALVMLLVLPAAAQRGDMERNDTSVLTVTGSGEVRSAPDEATVRLGITRQTATAREAQEGVNTIAQAILRAVTALGVPQEQIQTAQLTLMPVYSQPRPNAPNAAEEPKIVAYRATNTVSVRLERLDRVGPVIDAGLQAGANQLEGVQFALKNDQAARTRALREAVAEARLKAKAISDELEVRLTGVLEVVESGVSIRPPMYGGATMLRAAEASTPVSPGQVTVNASVTVRYRIQGKP